MCDRGRSPGFRIKNIRSGQGPASSLNCSAVFVLEFWFTGVSLYGASLGVGGGPSTSGPSYSHFYNKGADFGRFYSVILSHSHILNKVNSPLFNNLMYFVGKEMATHTPYSCLENPVDFFSRGVLMATVQRITNMLIDLQTMNMWRPCSIFSKG